ncbi:hypothetical protein AALP_AA5G152400 [Arabis alpina]|uniref:Dof-type domain-containing protein n=1 Tax=Arabis alpina TaxID=50452 RepID=A0A087GX88_ARAAL|nr:hypothetical protein AALP_AA5G152400 [Arabis alpina]
MEESRFETSELQASFMMSTPLWSDSWSLCHEANYARSIQIHHVAGIMYVAIPAVEIAQLGDLVGLEVPGVGNFSGLTEALAADEPPPMVDAAILVLFIKSKITEELKLEGREKVVITGHSTGGALATLTALWFLSKPSPPSISLLCITFGSPLLGNQTLSSSISRSRLAHNFCHVVSIHDHVPRRSNEQFWPFGTYLFCSDNGGVCLDNADSVRKMFLILNNTTTTPNIEEHLRYGHYVSTLSLQFLKSRSFLGGNISENSYQDGVALAVESLGFSNDEPSGFLAKEYIKTATTIRRAPILRATELAVELGNVLPSRLEIQWYKDRCDASEEKLGYYDFFKRHSLKRDFKVNLSRSRLARFWDRVFEMIEKNELPFDFHLGNKWIYASQFYQLLAEPLDIAFFYKHRDSTSVGHYLDKGNRPKRYEMMDKWWRRERKPIKEKFARTRHASATQDTCFWAKLEEAKEWLDEIRSENSTNAQRRSLLWQKIVGFESYADTLVKKMEVSEDVLAKSLTQPRYFCKGCRRYWTKGGSLRNVPVGGGCRKSRRPKSSSSSNGKTGNSCSSGGGGSPSIDLALVYANFLNPKADEPTLQENCDLASLVATDFLVDNPTMDQSWSMEINDGHQVEHIVEECGYNGLPPFPGEELLSIETNGVWSDALLIGHNHVDAGPAQAVYEPVVHFSDESNDSTNLLFGSWSPFDFSADG